jgi:hypothetical protein
MLSKCANPFCPNEFRYFGEGKVFEIRRDRLSNAAHANGKKRARTEHYWLCSSCSSTLTLAMDSSHNIVVIRRPQPDADRATA